MEGVRRATGAPSLEQTGKRGLATRTVRRGPVAAAPALTVCSA